MQRKKMLPINLYILMTLVSLVLWILVPEWSQIMGASSLFDAVLFSVSVGNRWISALVLLWILFFCIVFTVSYVLAYKQQKYIPILAICGMDLLVSFLFAVYKVYIKIYTGLLIMLLGLFARMVYHFWMIYFVERKQRAGDDSLS